MTGRHLNTLKWINGSWKCAHWVKVTCGRVVVNHLRNTERTGANGETHLPNAEKRISSSQEPVTCTTGQHDRSLGSKDTASWVWLATVIQSGPGSKMGCFLPDALRRGTSEKLSPMDSEQWLHCLLFFFFLATKLKLHLGIYPPICWSRCEPCSEIPIHSTDYLPGSCLKCSWAQMEASSLVEVSTQN